MRKIILVLFLLLTIKSTNVYSQNEKIGFKSKDITYEEFFDAIEKQTNFFLVYENKSIDKKQKIHLSKESGVLSHFLDEIFGETDIDYLLEDNYLILKNKPKNTKQVTPQKKVTGLVTDGNGLPIIGASIKEDQTTNGTITDIDGKFALTTASTASITISYIGFESQTIKIKDKSFLSVVLQENTELLDEVVVVGFGVQKKANLTGAVSSVKMDEVLGDRPVSSVSTALIGAMPGLQITGSSGRPGGEMSFNIRGVNSINKAAPLVLVDNVEMDINMLDPNDIESVSVLKDAASAAIYGARAAFGVVLITTKKGDVDTKIKLNYSNNLSFSRPGNMPKKATPLQTVQAYKDMGIIAYHTGQNVDTWLGFLDEYQKDPSLFPEGYAMSDGLRYNLAKTDLFKDMMETGFQHSHNLSASGGGSALTYRMSAGLVNQDGVLVYNKDTYKRYNVSSYLRSDAFDWITPELDIKFANSRNSMPSTRGGYGIWGAAVAFPSYFPLGDLDLDGEILPINTPRNLINLSHPTQSTKNDIRVFGKVTITPFKDLKLTGEYTFNRRTEETTSFEKKFRYAHGANFRIEDSVSNSKYQFTHASTNYNALNFYANYSKTYKEHDFQVMGGINQESHNYKSALMSRTDMINEDLPSITQATGDYFASDSFSKYTVRGLFYRLNYSYAGKYLVEMNGRYDGSSKFPSKKRFGFFPSVSLGWRVNEEHFMDWSRDFLSNLKLRGSWGNIGNQSIPVYAFIPGMDATHANWSIDGQTVTTLNPPQLVSNSFTWEKVKTIDLGLDLGLFDNRLSLIFDWYIRDTKGMLAPGMELPGVLGADAPLQNSADLRTKGWEVSVDWNDKIGEFSYFLGFNLFDGPTKITKYDNEVGLLGKYRKGMRLGEIWGYQTDRLYTLDDFDESGKLKSGIPVVEGYNPNPGDILYKDLDNNGVINNGKNTVYDSGDMKLIGNNTRRYQYGIKGGVQWKNIAFSFLLQGVGKRDIWVMNELFYPHYDPWSTVYSTQLDYWTPERPNSYFPRLYEKSEGNTSANTRKQTRFLQDGSYLSIRNITLSYSLPQSFIRKISLSGASVFFSGENLHTFDHLPKGIDSENSVTSDLGQRGFTYPYMRQYSFGINLSF